MQILGDIICVECIQLSPVSVQCRWPVRDTDVQLDIDRCASYRRCGL